MVGAITLTDVTAPDQGELNGSIAMANTTVSPKRWIVYRITNTVNGKCYIGVTNYSLQFRWNAHVNAAFNVPKRTEIDTFLWMAIRKYGSDTFTTFELYVAENESDAMTAERIFIYAFDSRAPTGYNMTTGGGGVGIRRPWNISTEGRLKKARAAHRDKNRLPGAVWVPSRKQWRATIRTNGKRISIGFFDTAEEAHAAYLQALEDVSHGREPHRHYRGRAHSFEKRLRMAQAQNAHGLPGAYWIPRRKKWSAMIRINGKQRRIGYFHTAEEASAAYLAALDTHLNQQALPPFAVHHQVALPFGNEVMMPLA